MKNFSAGGMYFETEAAIQSKDNHQYKIRQTSIFI
jgi:hypothetical protein